MSVDTAARQMCPRSSITPEHPRPRKETNLCSTPPTNHGLPRPPCRLSSLLGPGKTGQLGSGIGVATGAPRFSRKDRGLVLWEGTVPLRGDSFGRTWRQYLLRNLPPPQTRGAAPLPAFPNLALPSPPLSICSGLLLRRLERPSRGTASATASRVLSALESRNSSLSSQAGPALPTPDYRQSLQGIPSSSRQSPPPGPSGRKASPTGRRGSGG